MSDQQLKIVDFSTHLSGPLASRMLMDLGAEVIKVEHPVFGDGNRGLEPKIAGIGDLHVGLSAGARSLAVSTRSPHWSKVVNACAEWADGVLVGSRPVDARKRGLDFASLVKINPQIVYAAITGYGLDGPWSGYAAHGQNPDAMAGRVEVEWEDGKPVTRLGFRTAGSPLAGVFAALGLLAGIIKRDRGGGAQFVHTSLWETAMWWNWRDMNTLANLEEGWLEYQDRGSRYSMYETEDNGVVIVCPTEQKFWERFCDLLDLPDGWRSRGDWSLGADFGREDERPTIAEHMRARSLETWTQLLSEAEIPFAPVLSLRDALHSEHSSINGVLSETSVDGDQVRIARAPVRMFPDEQSASRSRAAHVDPPPTIGEHGEDILEQLGLTELLGEDLGAPR